MTKKYVTVLSRTDEEGFIEPRKIIIGTRHWPVKVLSTTPLNGRGARITRYEIAIPVAGGQYHTCLWYEVPELHSVRPKWFVETRD